MDPLQRSAETLQVQALRAEIDRLVSERQTLRRNGASEEELELNRRRLGRAQSDLSRLLVARDLPGPAAA
jgi:hypothetical protein